MIRNVQNDRTTVQNSLMLSRLIIRLPTSSGVRECTNERMSAAERASAASSAVHYGTKPGHFETSKIHFPTNKGVSKVSERANE